MLFSIVVLMFIFITGLSIGSFLNVVILRTVSGESIVFPASKCPKCQNPLKWYHNIPVLSYLFLRGKCAFCGEKISLQYPFVELLTGLLFVGLFLRFCSPFDALFGLSVMNPIGWYEFVMYIFSLIVVCLMIAIAGTDIIEKKVSDIHTYSLIGLGILCSLVYSVVTFILYTKANGLPKLDLDFFLTCPVLYSAAAAICGFLIMEALSMLGKLLVGKRAFGDGDSYIAAGIGSVFGTIVGCSPVYTTFLPVFQVLILTLVMSVALQVIFTLPVFIKKLFEGKDYFTAGALCSFIIYAIVYVFAQRLGWLVNPFAYWASMIVLLALGLFACYEIISRLKQNKEAGGLYLPFGPAMIVAAVIMMFWVNF